MTWHTAIGITLLGGTNVSHTSTLMARIYFLFHLSSFLFSFTALCTSDVITLFAGVLHNGQQPSPLLLHVTPTSARGASISNSNSALQPGLLAAMKSFSVKNPVEQATGTPPSSKMGATDQALSIRRSTRELIVTSPMVAHTLRWNVERSVFALIY